MRDKALHHSFLIVYFSLLNNIQPFNFFKGPCNIPQELLLWSVTGALKNGFGGGFHHLLQG
jgi:hypothetical protein